MLAGRLLSRDEIKRIWSIDRSEVIDAVYYLEDENLVLKPEHYDMKGWPPGEAHRYRPVLEVCYDQGGWFYGLFDGSALVGVARSEAIHRGAKRLYISATPSENTVNFYLRLGCELTSQADPELFELEPDDIHLEYRLK
jgi:hypothetical protein